MYVLEARAIAELFALRPVAVLREPLTELVEDGEATFPDDVLVELRQHYKDEHCCTWATGIRSARSEAAVPWSDKQDVEEDHPDLVDHNSAREQCAPSVLAQARRLRTMTTVTIVTEDVGEKPARTSLAAAADRDGIRWIRARGFLAEVAL